MKDVNQLNIKQDQIVPHESDEGRTYTVDTGTMNIEVPSVTTVTDILGKPALVPWAYNVGIEETLWLAQSDPSMVESLTVPTVKATLKDLGKDHTARKDAGGDRGQFIHDYWEAIVTGKELPEIPHAYSGYVENLNKALDAYGISWDYAEIRVASIEHGYAGRLDGVGTITKHPTRRRHESLIGKRTLVDLKTNKDGKVYPKQHLPQVEGYAHALNEMGDNDIQAKLVLAIGPDNWSPCVSYARPELFLRILDTWKEFDYMKHNNPNGRS